MRGGGTCGWRRGREGRPGFVDHETPLRVPGQDNLGGGTLLQGLLGKGRHEGAAGAALLSIALTSTRKHTHVQDYC